MRASSIPASVRGVRKVCSVRHYLQLEVSDPETSLTYEVSSRYGAPIINESEIRSL